MRETFFAVVPSYGEPLSLNEKHVASFITHDRYATIEAAERAICSSYIFLDRAPYYIFQVIIERPHELEKKGSVWVMYDLVRSALCAAQFVDGYVPPSGGRL